MLKIGVLYGGRSSEHDVSKCSAASVITALDKSKYEVIAIGIDRDGKWYVQDKPEIVNDKDFGKSMGMEINGSWYINHYQKDDKLFIKNFEIGKEVYVDLIFPVLHGTFCEDGTLQGLLEMSMVPFVGCGTAGSAIGMDKDVTKRLLNDCGIPIVPWITVYKKNWELEKNSIINDIQEKIDFPFFVKPANSGSSVGIKKVKTPDEIDEAVEFAFRYDHKILIEKGIDAREIECAVLGNDTPEASVLGEILPRHEFYSYEAKYIDPNGADLIIPAVIDNNMAEKIKRSAVDAFKILNCSGLARVDFFVDKNNGRYYFNEINTMPGFTSISMYPKLWECSGISYKSLLDRLIDLGIERHKESKKIIA